MRKLDYSWIRKLGMFSPKEQEAWIRYFEDVDVAGGIGNSKVSDLTGSKEDVIPSYYSFPGGVEVRDISAHLMSFPSQILQYASRSGRVDGNCKSEDVADKIRDFEKIIDFARWEIERLENE